MPTPEFSPEFLNQINSQPSEAELYRAQQQDVARLLNDAQAAAALAMAKGVRTDTHVQFDDGDVSGWSLAKRRAVGDVWKPAYQDRMYDNDGRFSRVVDVPAGYHKETVGAEEFILETVGSLYKLRHTFRQNRDGVVVWPRVIPIEDVLEGSHTISFERFDAPLTSVKDGLKEFVEINRLAERKD